MSRILASMLVIVSVIGAVGGTTLAVFSDTASILGNTVSTAQVNIDARPEANETTEEKPVVATGLVPGEWSDWYRMVVFNESNSTNVRAYMYVTNVVGAACSKINLKVTTGHAGSDAGERANVIYNSVLSGIDTPNERIELTGFVFTAPNWLPSNTSLVVQQQAQLDSSADNAQANSSCTWDEVFVAETP